jgi:hypothetical protein
MYGWTQEKKVLTIRRSQPVEKQCSRTGSRAHLFLASLAIVGLFASANAYGSPIDVTPALQNAAFTSPNITGACPTSWSCGGADPGGEYQPGSVEYNPATDGIGAYAPQGNGTWVFEQPSIEGQSSLVQINSTDDYEAGNSYYLDLWLGTPMKVYNSTGECGVALCAAAPIQEVELIWLAGNSTAAIDTITLTIPTTGQWINDQAQTTFSIAAGDHSLDGKAISVEVYAVCTATPCNNLVSDVQFTPTPYIPPPTTPEPGTFMLIGGGMVALAYGFRRKSLRNS